MRSCIFSDPKAVYSKLRLLILSVIVHIRPLDHTP